MADATRTGLVTEITPPAEGKKQYFCKLGQKKVWFYGTPQDSDEPTELLLRLRDAEAQGLSVTVEGYERPGNFNGKPYVSFTAERVLETGPATNGSKAAESHAQPMDPPRRRDPATEALIIAQNLLNRATDLACAGIIKVDDIRGQAQDMVDDLVAVAGKVKHELEHPSWPES